ncbi:MAG: hypothetical protein KCHDKBKB_02873 [Elusimicrobia bacterium]|nr:hypothetical protein [Elusimicrobiota bacterium]
MKRSSRLTSGCTGRCAPVSLLRYIAEVGSLLKKLSVVKLFFSLSLVTSLASHAFSLCSFPPVFNEENIHSVKLVNIRNRNLSGCSITVNIGSQEYEGESISLRTCFRTLGSEFLIKSAMECSDTIPNKGRHSGVYFQEPSRKEQKFFLSHRYSPQALSNKAESLRVKGFTTEAIILWEKVIEVSPDYIEAQAALRHLKGNR